MTATTAGDETWWELPSAPWPTITLVNKTSIPLHGKLLWPLLTLLPGSPTVFGLWDSSLDNVFC
jgi:hypothetical protein